jgi:hypothetical protein
MTTPSYGTGPWGEGPWGGFTKDNFVADFPEFDTSGNADPAKAEFADSAINYWLHVAQIMLNPDRWSTSLVLATELFMAHHLALEALAMRDMDAGAVPGIAKGVVAGKAAGDVSVSYDTGSVLELGAGHWNYTIYGKRFYRMAQMFGAGPVQIGIGGPSPENSGEGWGGPPPWPGWFSS